MRGPRPRGCQGSESVPRLSDSLVSTPGFEVVPILSVLLQSGRLWSTPGSWVVPSLKLADRGGGFCVAPEIGSGSFPFPTFNLSVQSCDEALRTGYGGGLEEAGRGEKDEAGDVVRFVLQPLHDDVDEE